MIHHTVKGEMTSTTEKGIEFIIKQGEVMVRRAGLHGWKNSGAQQAQWAVVVNSNA